MQTLKSSKNEVLYFNLNDFAPAYCITCYRMQGSTTILKPRQMAKGEIYECYNETRNLYYVGYTTTTTKKRFQEHCQEKEDPIFKTSRVKRKSEKSKGIIFRSIMREGVSWLTLRKYQRKVHSKRQSEMWEWTTV
mmetsp:Transcript_3710/g.5622  ORF Transcript_3710/g.5622 Transcript_3710/m.5622 type:complete len:135 (+) Transcript_3710:586-990(+)